MNNYIEFLQRKVVIAEDYGFDIERSDLNQWLKPHCLDICQWALTGGRRAIFANFGLHKTSMQLELSLMRSIIRLFDAFLFLKLY